MNLSGVFEAKVLSIDWSKKQARIAFVGSEQVYVARMVRDIWTKDHRTKPTTPLSDGGHGSHLYEAYLGDHTHGEHTHRLSDDLQAGDAVLVMFMRGRSDSVPIITHRL